MSTPSLRFFALVVSIISISVGVRAQESSAIDANFIAKSIQVHGAEERYVVYVPPAYSADQAWPLIVFLHGAGERGDDNEAPIKQGIANAIRKTPERFPAIVLFPQCPKGQDFNTYHDALDGELAATREAYNIDAARIYLTGLSMGGYGTWLWGAIHTDTFAALMPICGGGDPADIQKLLNVGGGNPYGSMASRLRSLATIPIWAFHGGSDSVVPVDRSRFMVEAIQARGGTIRYTEFDGVDHNSWDTAYQETEGIAWLLQQRKP